MFGKKTKKESTTAKSPLVQEPLNHDFVPYACHYDNSTMLTKNGELLKTIKISGFGHDTTNDDMLYIREEIRSAISEHVKENDFAVYIHLFHTKSDIRLTGDYQQYFAHYLNEIWNSHNKWDGHFINEIYVTIIIKSGSTVVNNPISFLASLSAVQVSHSRFKKMDKSIKRLSAVANNIVESIGKDRARILRMVEKNNVFYSEQLSFFGKLVNFLDKDYPVSVESVAAQLFEGSDIIFGNNILQTGNDENRRFATVLSVKEHPDLSISSIDKILQLPQEFIIVQELNFIDGKSIVKDFEYQNYILKVSKDTELLQAIDVRSIISENITQTSHGVQQLTITLINSSLSGLREDVNNFYKNSSELGIVCIREDVFMEQCFWSQLPGNFHYLCRQLPIVTSEAGVFASFSSSSMGTIVNSKGEEALTILKTSINAPYFLSLYGEKNDHSIIVGGPKSGRTLLLNFLVAQSLKYDDRIYYFDNNASSEIFINAVGGVYNELSDGKNNFEELLKIDSNIVGFNFAEILKNPDKKPLASMISSVLNKVEQLPKGKRTVIIFDEAWEFFDNEILGSGLGDILNKLKNFGVSVIMTTRSMRDVDDSYINNRNIKNYFSTQIFLPDPDAGVYYEEVFNLDKSEISLIRLMRDEGRFFVVKQDENELMISFDLSLLRRAMLVLSGGRNANLLMKLATKKKGDNPEDWLPLYFELTRGVEEDNNYKVSSSYLLKVEEKIDEISTVIDSRKKGKIDFGKGKDKSGSLVAKKKKVTQGLYNEGIKQAEQVIEQATTTEEVTAKPLVTSAEEEKVIKPVTVSEKLPEKELLEELPKKEELAGEKVEAVEIEKEKADLERLVAEQKAREEEDKNKVEEQIAALKAIGEKEELKAEKGEIEKLAKKEAEAKKIAKEQEEIERLAKEQAEKFAVEKAEAERKAKEKAKKLAAEKAEVDRIAKEKAEAERIVKEQEEIRRIAKEEAEKLEAKRVAEEKKSKAETERLKAELEKLRSAKEEIERMAKEREEAAKLDDKEQKAKEEAEELKLKKKEEERKKKEEGRLAADKERIEEARKLKESEEAEEREEAEEEAKEEARGDEAGESNETEEGGEEDIEDWLEGRMESIKHDSEKSEKISDIEMLNKKLKEKEKKKEKEKSDLDEGIESIENFEEY